MMKHYLFENTESGEQFIVGEITLGTAIAVAVSYFDEAVRYICQLSEMEAEASGLDEY